MSRKLFLLGGLVSFFVALLHLVIIFIGAPGYRFFGAGEKMAQMAESGSASPAVITVLIALVFTIFGCYAFSGAGFLPRLPKLRMILLLIGLIYTMRGLAVFFEILTLFAGSGSNAIRWAVFSLAALVTGIAYLYATIADWKKLNKSKG